MNGLPQDVNFAPIIGRTVEQVRFSRWSLQSLLDGLDKIAVESRLCIRSNGIDVVVDDYAANATEICSILGTRIVDAQRAQDGGMEIRMSSGASVCIQNSEPHHESFQIHLGDAVVVA